MLMKAQHSPLPVASPVQAPSKAAEVTLLSALNTLPYHNIRNSCLT